jgi:hypothetical protein
MPGEAAPKPEPEIAMEGRLPAPSRLVPPPLKGVFMLVGGTGEESFGMDGVPPLVIEDRPPIGAAMLPFPNPELIPPPTPAALGLLLQLLLPLDESRLRPVGTPADAPATALALPEPFGSWLLCGLSFQPGGAI